MKSTNICWECKHDTFKLKILVPSNHTIKEYVLKTGKIQSQIVTISKEEQGKYKVWLRSEGKLRLLCFKMFHVCKLRQGQKKSDKVGANENYDLKNEPSSISNIISSKTPKPEPNKT